ncbi:hypothetical protein K502DRAFT_355129 [Neoconidiobolus thromboides FSU 785]|nr:hypothetical protein K502DRAFT_355129 [Neoconidiobolus thromboides FSU 785]
MTSKDLIKFTSSEEGKNNDNIKRKESLEKPKMEFQSSNSNILRLDKYIFKHQNPSSTSNESKEKRNIKHNKVTYKETSYKSQEVKDEDTELKVPSRKIVMGSTMNRSKSFNKPISVRFKEEKYHMPDSNKFVEEISPIYNDQLINKFTTKENINYKDGLQFKVRPNKSIKSTTKKKELKVKYNNIKDTLSHDNTNLTTFLMNTSSDITSSTQFPQGNDGFNDLNSDLTTLDIILVDNFSMIEDKMIVSTITESEIEFLKQNRNDPSYRTTLLMLALLALNYVEKIKERYPSYFAFYLQRLNNLFTYVNQQHSRSLLSMSNCYYLNLAITLSKFLPNQPYSQ